MSIRAKIALWILGIVMVVVLVVVGLRSCGSGGGSAPLPPPAAGSGPVAAAPAPPVPDPPSAPLGRWNFGTSPKKASPVPPPTPSGHPPGWVPPTVPGAPPVVGPVPPAPPSAAGPTPPAPPPPTATPSTGLAKGPISRWLERRYAGKIGWAETKQITWIASWEDKFGFAGAFALCLLWWLLIRIMPESFFLEQVLGYGGPLAALVIIRPSHWGGWALGIAWTVGYGVSQYLTKKWTTGWKKQVALRGCQLILFAVQVGLTYWLLF